LLITTGYIFILENKIYGNIYLFSDFNFEINMNRIKEVLKEKGIKQTWLAEKLGKSYNMVNAYVQNRQQPKIEVLYEIAKLLEVEAKDLLIEQKDLK
jgi:transcriptional regulator with XRE-family HTH domain